MILDLEEIYNEPVFTADICVIGTGAAGLMIANEMAGTTHSVIFLESGGGGEESETQALYNVVTSGDPLPGATEGRFRILGGSTTQWGGQGLPLMPIDFEKRDWVAHSGWPISYDSLTPYYPKATQFMMVNAKDERGGLFSYAKSKPTDLDPSRVWYHFSRWSPRPNLRDTYLPMIKASKTMTLILHANVVDMGLTDDLTTVETVSIRSLGGQSATVKSKYVVICAGGIESARVLLYCNRQLPTGIGNHHDLVGRYFQDHPSAAVGTLVPTNRQDLSKYFNIFHRDSVKYSVRLTASPDWQRATRSLNISAGITFDENQTQLELIKSGFVALRQGKLLDPRFLTAIGTMLRHPIQVGSPIYQYLVHSRSVSPHAKMRVGMTSEQAPDPESRIRLSTQRDALGLPRADICWKIRSTTLSTMQAYAEVLKSELHRTGMGQLVLDPWISGEDDPNWRTHVTDQYHHMGTTRMATSPTDGVVDLDSRVYGTTNLFVGSSSVFPTSGHSNPTLTLLALCGRLADYLKGELG